MLMQLHNPLQTLMLFLKEWIKIWKMDQSTYEIVDGASETCSLAANKFTVGGTGNIMKIC